jgi:phosphate-selective porin OprO/OprP
MLRRSTGSRLGLFAATALAGAFAFGPAARAQATSEQAVATAGPEAPSDPRDAEIRALREELAALSAQVADLKTAMSSGLKDMRAAQAAQDKVVVSNGKPALRSADGNFSAELHGVVQFDAGGYFQRDAPLAQTDAHARDLNDGTNFRRARIGIGGKLYGDFNYNVLFDFGGYGSEDAGKIQEAWVEYAGLPHARFRVGAFAPLLGLEDAVSTNSMLFLERPAMAEIARTLAGGDRRTGAQAAFGGDHWLAAAAVTSNGVSTLNTAASGFGSQNYDEQLGYTGRIAVSPLHGEDYLVHIGANGSLVAKPGDAGPAAAIRYGLQLRDRPELSLDSTRLIDTGAIDADGARQFGLELAAQKKNFYVEGEYFDISIKRRNPALSDPGFKGWYVEGGWVLTGEPRRYNPLTAAFDGPSPVHPFGQDGGLGGFELGLRYSVADLDYHQGLAGAATPLDGVRGVEQKIIAAGLNWYLNTDVRLMLQYQHVDISRLSPAGAEIGQDYNSLAVRSQVAF